MATTILRPYGEVVQILAWVPMVLMGISVILLLKFKKIKAERDIVIDFILKDIESSALENALDSLANNVDFEFSEEERTRKSCADANYGNESLGQREDLKYHKKQSVIIMKYFWYMHKIIENNEHVKVFSTFGRHAERFEKRERARIKKEEKENSTKGVECHEGGNMAV